MENATASQEKLLNQAQDRDADADSKLQLAQFKKQNDH